MLGDRLEEFLGVVWPGMEQHHQARLRAMKGVTTDCQCRTLCDAFVDWPVVSGTALCSGSTETASPRSTPAKIPCIHSGLAAAVYCRHSESGTCGCCETARAAASSWVSRGWA